jgi:hypothetical protein
MQFKTYNRFFALGKNASDILRLPSLHAAMDAAVFTAYGHDDRATFGARWCKRFAPGRNLVLNQREHEHAFRSPIRNCTSPQAGPGRA